MNYKTIFLGAVIGVSMQNAWGMDGTWKKSGLLDDSSDSEDSDSSGEVIMTKARVRQCARIKNLEDTINNKNQQSYTNTNNNNNNANMPVAPNATNSNNPPPYAPSSAPLVENDSIARLAAAIEAMNENMERMVIVQDKQVKLQQEMKNQMVQIYNHWQKNYCDKGGWDGDE